MTELLALSNFRCSDSLFRKPSTCLAWIDLYPHYLLAGSISHCLLLPGDLNFYYKFYPLLYTVPAQVRHCWEFEKISPNDH